MIPQRKDSEQVSKGLLTVLSLESLVAGLSGSHIVSQTHGLQFLQIGVPVGIVAGIPNAGTELGQSFLDVIVETSLLGVVVILLLGGEDESSDLQLR